VSLSAQIRKFRRWRRLVNAVKELDSRNSSDLGEIRNHGLPAPLVVSLTSYPARFASLSLTLRSILFQTVRPDSTILWIAHGDFESLPANVLNLRKYGLEIARCDDIRSFKKIVPTLASYPESFVITVDDDLWYPADLLEKLAGQYDGLHRCVISRRAHKVRLSSGGKPVPYVDWEIGIERQERSTLIFPTGGAGALYPPGCFHEDVCKVELFSALSATADDVWLYWMWRMNGYLGHKTAGRPRLIEWQGSQDTSLRTENLSGGENDRCINNLVKRYGFPF
jgi:hypothetical protein